MSNIELAGAIQVPEQAAPATPTSGFGAIYFKTDGKAYAKNDGGTEYDLTASGGGGGAFAANIGNGSDTDIEVTHSLATRDVLVSVYRNASPWDVQIVPIELTSTNTITIKFSEAPATNAFRVVVRS